MKVNIINVQVKFDTKPEVPFGQRSGRSSGNFKSGVRGSTQMISTLQRTDQEN